MLTRRLQVFWGFDRGAALPGPRLGEFKLTSMSCHSLTEVSSFADMNVTSKAPLSSKVNRFMLAAQSTSPPPRTRLTAMAEPGPMTGRSRSPRNEAPDAVEAQEGGGAVQGCWAAAKTHRHIRRCGSGEMGL